MGKPTLNVSPDAAETRTCCEDEAFHALSDDGLSEASVGLIDGDDNPKPPSAYKRRKMRLTRQAALQPENSFERFKNSFNNSSASAALKARFANLSRKSG